MFPNHLLEIFDLFQIDRVFFLSEIDKRASIGAVFRNDDLDGTVGVDVTLERRRSMT